MMEAQQLMIGVVAGCALIAVGLIPGILQATMDGIQNFSDALQSGFPIRPQQRRELRQPVWLAALGAALIVLTILASAWN